MFANTFKNKVSDLEIDLPEGFSFTEIIPNNLNGCFEIQVAITSSKALIEYRYSAFGINEQTKSQSIESLADVEQFRRKIWNEVLIDFKKNFISKGIK